MEGKSKPDHCKMNPPNPLNSEEFTDDCGLDVEENSRE